METNIPSNLIEKRRTPRLEERDRVTVTVLASPEVPEIERHSFHCWTHDLSEDGLKFVVHTGVPIGAILKLEVVFAHSADDRFTHIGRVMWEQEFEEDGIVSNWLGVKFTETLGGPHRREAWKNIIRGKLAASRKSPAA